ncbi:Rv3654c family TadE-like protein [Actinoplanes sp. NPDC020271]|uniref:Rv3654c family TadE-like protein n=1 Tax=Actinoplanes sp. NPDC020271 TaxID=3363896 RepID=UPI00379FE237
MARQSRDRGAASIFVLAVGLFLVAAGIAGAMAGAARVARHVARNAADLAALAGAGRAIEGAEVACAAARQYAEANGARLTSCQVSALEVIVRAEVSVRSSALKAAAAARAGPVEQEAAWPG